MRRPSSPCTHPGCPHRATHAGRCALHARSPAPDLRPSAARRGYDAEWRAIRARFRAAYPWCVVCGAPATVVDHIVSLARGGTHDEANLQPFCSACHNHKTIAVDGGGWRRR